VDRVFTVAISRSPVYQPKCYAPSGDNLRIAQSIWQKYLHRLPDGKI
jgi:hypothetical protein